ncbi:hypothetical protein GUJ93_ZPchr0005g15130 [Zizania palustris]|uniref:DUF4219 domain-containing protein n=1 Tax=Zizania palustris TaxID=103762 RepID=A0A8J5SCD5_ZIZPA|nr:hypothetical protein GUJ93_ZPchr0005g15130 [Zizania palustris]
MRRVRLLWSKATMRRVRPLWSEATMRRNSKIPMFDGRDYAYWKVRMEAYLLSQGSAIWDIVDSQYVIPETRTSETEKL